MSKEDLIEKLKPYMYCYVGSGMLTNDYNENTALSFANSCADIAEEYADEEKKKKSIEFVLWCNSFEYVLLSDGTWVNADGNGITTEQLYELFNQQK